MGLEELSQNPVVIFSAYICVFLPWTIISATDYLSDRWKTVRQTEARGRLNLMLSVVPSSYVLFYVYVQAASKDYTEACAALVALFFAILHAARSAWGLWQLLYFRRWVITCVKSLYAMGISYDLHGKVANGKETEYLSPERVADQILVNNILVDNVIRGGRTPCNIAYGEFSLQMEPLTKEGNTNRTGQRWTDFLFQRLAAIGQFLNCCRALFIDTMTFQFVARRHEQVETHRRILKLVPANPVDVWLTWSTVFAAQGLEDWIKNFSISADPGTARGSQKAAADKFRDQVAFFRAEVLSSAILQLLPEISGSNSMPTPFLWSDWEDESQMARGLAMRTELLGKAVSSERSMPFGSGQTDSRLHRSVREGRGYVPYRRKLQNIISELPIREEFSAEMDENWDIANIDWLAILLYLGYNQTNHQARRINKTGCRSHSGTCNPVIQNLSTLSNEDEIQKDDKSVQALNNLRLQLVPSDLPKKNGDTSTVNGRETGNSMRTSAWSSFPFHNIRWEHYVSESNRHVLSVGDIIDIWSALSAGSDISFLLDKMNSEWKFWCLGRDAPINHLEHSMEGFPTDFKSLKKAIQNNEIDIVHANLEIRRIRSQFANKDIPISQVEQYLVFMGYRMETVRTNLGIILKARGRYPGNNASGSAETNRFETLALENEYFKTPTEEGRMIILTSSFEHVLDSEDPRKLLSRRGVQVRLIWELQEALANTDKERIIPPRIVSGTSEGENSKLLDTIFLCILSYPSLHVPPDPVTFSDHDRSPKSYSDDHCFPRGSCVNITRKISQVHKREEVEIKIIPTCAPQDCWILCKLGISSETKAYAKIFLSFGAESFIFKWNYWRDSFAGRLRGQKIWFDQHSMPCPDVNETKSSTNIFRFDSLRTATNESFLTYVGWRPHRFGFNLYDLSETGILRQSQRMYKVVTKFPISTSSYLTLDDFEISKRVRVSYDEALSEVLRHYSVLVQTAERPSESSTSSRNNGQGATFRELADRNAKEGQMEVAAQLYELAATEANDAGALELCADILKAGNMSRKNPLRVITLLEKYIGKFASTEQLSLNTSPDVHDAMKAILTICLPLVESYGDLFQFGRDIWTFLIVYLSIIGDNEKGALQLLNMMYSYLRSSPGANWADFTGNYCAALSLVHAKPSIESTHFDIDVEALSMEPKEVDEVSFSLALENEQLQILLLEQAVSKGSSSARNMLGIILEGFLMPDRGPIDAVRAISLHEEASAHGNLYSKIRLVWIYRNGLYNTPTDNQRVYSLLDDLILQQDYSFAKVLRGIFQTEDGIETTGILSWYENEEVKEDTGTMVNLAELLWTGAENEELDRDKAIHLCEQAIEADGSADAKAALALFLSVGTEKTPADIPRAKILCEEAIQMNGSGALAAKLMLSKILSEESNKLSRKTVRKMRALFEDLIISKDTDRSYWLDDTLRRSDLPIPMRGGKRMRLYGKDKWELLEVIGMLNYASLILEGGALLNENKSRAVDIYKKAISRSGSVVAKINLGYLLWHGLHGVEKDEEEAVLLYIDAITEQGSTVAMVLLANALVKGSRNFGADPYGASKLYREAIRLQPDGFEEAYLGLYTLLKRGAMGFAADSVAAREVLENALKIGIDVERLLKDSPV